MIRGVIVRGILQVVKLIERIVIALLAAAIALCCFEPWVEYGDVVPHIRSGVEVSDAFLLDCGFSDNGGGKFLIAVGLAMLLSLLGPTLTRRWPAYLLGCGVALIGFSAFELIRVWLWQRRLSGVIGAPLLMPAPFVLAVASLLLLVVSLRTQSAP